MPWLKVEDDCRDGVEALARIMAGKEWRRKQYDAVKILKPAEPKQEIKVQSEPKKMPIPSETRLPTELAHALQYKRGGKQIPPEFLVTPAQLLESCEVIRQYANLRKIVARTADYFNLLTDELRGKSRGNLIVLQRHICMYVALKITGFSLTRIGRYLRRDHTTVLYGIRRIEALIKCNDDVRCHVDALIKLNTQSKEIGA